MRVTDRLRNGKGIAVALLVLAQAGCAPTGAPRTPREPSPPREPSEAAAEARAHRGAEEAKPYDLDAEMPTKTRPDAAAEEEDIEPIVADTFHVEEALPAPPEVVYGVGYRVQVSASHDLEAAREVQKKVMAGTGLAAYIEYENGLYKVRAGDFATREEASAARAALAEPYPGCWIVQTTIETGR